MGEDAGHANKGFSEEALRGLDTELPQVIWSGMVLKSLSPTAEKTEK